MARKLKTYVATSGFFELAVAAPSMKAALEIWGAGPDLFQRGYAKETNDASIIKAAMAKPGVVLRRGVGSRGGFKEHADLPDVSAWKKPAKKPAASQPAAPRKETPAKTTPARAKVADPAPERRAARQYEANRKKREREAARVVEAERRARARREQAVEKAEAALKAATDAHGRRLAVIEAERAAVEQRARDEDERWQDERHKLEGAIARTKA